MRRMHEVLRLRAHELEDANRVKDEFLATMSHELRTPLTSILGWARLLGSNQLTDRDKERAIHVIQRNAEAQAKLIEDLLDVSRIITEYQDHLQPRECERFSISLFCRAVAARNKLRAVCSANRRYFEKTHPHALTNI